MFAAAEAFLFGRRHHLAVDHESRRRIVEQGVDSKHSHARPLPAFPALTFPGPHACPLAGCSSASSIRVSATRRVTTLCPDERMAWKSTDRPGHAGLVVKHAAGAVRYQLRH